MSRENALWIGGVSQIDKFETNLDPIFENFVTLSANFRPKRNF